MKTAEGVWDLADSWHVHMLNTWRYLNTILGPIVSTEPSPSKPERIKGLATKSWKNVTTPKTGAQNVRTNLRSESDGSDVAGSYEDINLADTYHKTAVDIVMKALTDIGFENLSITEKERFYEKWVDRVNRYGYHFRVYRYPK
jgi:hypothetical protein